MKDVLLAARAKGRRGGRPKVEEKILAMKMFESQEYSLYQIWLLAYP